MTENQIYHAGFSIKELDIRVDEFFEFSGYTDIPDILISGADDILKEISDYSSIEGGYVIVHDVKMDSQSHSVILNGQALNVSKRIFGQIKNSESIAVFLCTAGKGITDLSREIIQKGDIVNGYLADMMGSFMVEKAMGKIHDYLEQECNTSELKITNRFSPGYCQWNVAEQKKIFSFFPGNFCNVMLTDTCLMIPIKSVSGIIGVGKKVNRNVYQCDICDEKNCLYKRKSKT